MLSKFTLKNLFSSALVCVLLNSQFSYAANAKELSFAIKVFGQIFTWPSDQPRHATLTSHSPVDSNSPPVKLNGIHENNPCMPFKRNGTHRDGKWPARNCLLAARFSSFFS